jgi:hypothetical protein
MLRDDLELNWSWNSGKHRGTGFFALIWNLFMVPFYIAVLGSSEWLMGVFLLPFTAVGFGAAYFWAANKFNLTTIKVEGDMLSTHQFPFPTRKKRLMHVESIEQLWVERTVPYEENDQPVICFSVMLSRQDGQTINLVPHMHTPEQALWVEQQVEDCLGIVDIEVPGEVVAPNKNFTAPSA